MTVRILFVVLALVLACSGAVIAADNTSSDTALRTTADVDSARFVEFANIFGGRVLGYTAHDHQIRGSYEHKAGEPAEGAKCGGHGDDGCCEESCCCRDGWYDCWGVWQADDQSNFASTRDSDYDPVLGRGQSGGDGIWGWHGW